MEKKTRKFGKTIDKGGMACYNKSDKNDDEERRKRKACRERAGGVSAQGL